MLRHLWMVELIGFSQPLNPEISVLGSGSVGAPIITLNNVLGSLAPVGAAGA